MHLCKFSNSSSATLTRRLDDLKLLLLLQMSRGVSISRSMSPIWWNPSSGLSGHLQIDPWAAAFWKHFTLILSCSALVICLGQSSPSYWIKTYVSILYDTCCVSKPTWYWTSARELWDFEAIKNLSWQDEFCINRLTQWTFNVSLTFFAFSWHSDWYPSSMDSLSTYWSVIFGNILFAYSANCFGDLMTTLFVRTWE